MAHEEGEGEAPSILLVSTLRGLVGGSVFGGLVAVLGLLLSPEWEVLTATVGAFAVGAASGPLGFIELHAARRTRGIGLDIVVAAASLAAILAAVEFAVLDAMFVHALVSGDGFAESIDKTWTRVLRLHDWSESVRVWAACSLPFVIINVARARKAHDLVATVLSAVAVAALATLARSSANSTFHGYPVRGADFIRDVLATVFFTWLYALIPCAFVVVLFDAFDAGATRLRRWLTRDERA